MERARHRFPALAVCVKDCEVMRPETKTRGVNKKFNSSMLHLTSGWEQGEGGPRRAVVNVHYNLGFGIEIKFTGI